jgi:hypothetical protein
MQGESEADPTPCKACVIEMHGDIKKFHKIQTPIRVNGIICGTTESLSQQA